MSARIEITKPDLLLNKRRTKGELIAPRCNADCIKSHTIEQTAAILGVSRRTVERLLEAKKIAAVACGTGKQKQTRRISHKEIRRYQDTV